MDEPDKADIIFVYDYCRLMWALSEEHAEHHWWASENLKKKLTGTGGPALVSAYNVMTQVGVIIMILNLHLAVLVRMRLGHMTSDMRSLISGELLA